MKLIRCCFKFCFWSEVQGKIILISSWTLIIPMKQVDVALSNVESIWYKHNSCLLKKKEEIDKGYPHFYLNMRIYFPSHNQLFIAKSKTNWVLIFSCGIEFIFWILSHEYSRANVIVLPASKSHWKCENVV